MVDESEHGQTARTRYRVLDRAGNRAAWVELQPLTGRTHQLRVHMAAIGHPIVGDGKYGGPEAFLTGSDQPQDAPPCPPPDHRPPRRRPARRHRRRCPSTSPRAWRSSASTRPTGEALPEAPARLRREGEKAAAKAHAKQYRKERRGERRGRKSGERGPAGKAAAKPAEAHRPRPAPPTRRQGAPRPTLPQSRRAKARTEPGARQALMHPNAAFRHARTARCSKR